MDRVLLEGSDRAADGEEDAGRGSHPTACRCGRTASTQVEAAAEATGRSSVSRQLRGRPRLLSVELMARGFSGLDVAVIMIDRLDVAGQCCVVALVICADGTKS